MEYLSLLANKIGLQMGVTFSPDMIMVMIFLILNLAIGMYSGRGVKTIKEYAVGNRTFSTASLTATVIATCIGGGFFASAISETYRQGLYFLIPAMGEPLALIIVGYFLVPRMVEFLHTLSVAEAMGELYGKHVRIITAFCGICLCVGMVALEFKVGASVLQVFLGVNGFYAVLTSAIIIIAYSSFGGIKSVTLTDVLQFFTFCAIIPIISLIIWGTFDNPGKVFDMLAINDLFNTSKVLDPGNEEFVGAALLFIVYLFPEFQPVFFQRVVMASTAIQARRAFIMAGTIVLALYVVTVWVSVLMLADSPGLDPNNLLPHMIQKYSYPGFKGLTAIGVLAIVMSTADSYINSAAVLFSHDIYKVINPKHVSLVERSELRLPRIAAVSAGVFAFILAFVTSSILELLLFVLAFYAPIVSIPLILSLFGFRTTSKSVLISMAGGAITVLSIQCLDLSIQPIVPGIFANLIFLLGSHYLLKQKGGWVGIKDYSVLNGIKEKRRNLIASFIHNTKHFNLLAFCKNNLPKTEVTYTMLGIFCIISVFSTIYSLDNAVRHQHEHLIDFIYHTALVASAILVSYPIWPPAVKSQNFIAVFWNLVLPYALIGVPMLLVIISNFGQLQLMIFMINLIMVAMMLRWQVAILMIFIGVVGSLQYYSYHMGVPFGDLGIGMSLEFKITYILLLFISVLLAFIKPSQEEKQLAEEKAIHLWEKVSDMDKEIRKAEELKKEFLNNINHEVRTPVTGITSLGQALWDNYNDIPEEKRKECVHTIAKSADRLISLINNILDLSSLTSLKIQMNITNVNLSNLVKERITKCKKLYLEQKSLDFVLDIDDNLYVKCDEYHISHTIDNLIINAINYSNDDTTINIRLKNTTEGVEFSIRDIGIGIPSEELLGIFHPFTVGSKTRSPAGGRGIGLALCSAAIKSHEGRIWAESDGVSWAEFKFCLK